MTKPLSATKIASLSPIFKAIEDARVQGKPTVYLSHPRPSSLYFDLCRARTTLFPQWKNQAVKFFKHPLGVEVRIHVPVETIELPKGELPILPQRSYMKIASHMVDTKPPSARFAIGELSPEEIGKLEILSQHLGYTVIRDSDTISFSRT